ncbi:MAG: iron-containing alcohol dehydrogenase, partial [Spirochaetaceae bacterium]|nr:iron-containing alcohol dehydrogenase [Spirochaetaceae bacterium]
YFTKEQHVEVTDELCEGILRVIIQNAKVVMTDPRNYDARAELMWAGSLAHNGLLGTGRIEDWASHLIEHELSAIYDIAHGAGLSIIFPCWMEYCLKEDPHRFARFANKIFGVGGASEDLEQIGKKGISKLRDFFRSLGLPISFKDAGLSNERIPEMAKKVTAAASVGQFKKLNEEDVNAIYCMATEVK